MKLADREPADQAATPPPMATSVSEQASPRFHLADMRTGKRVRPSPGDARRMRIVDQWAGLLREFVAPRCRVCALDCQNWERSPEPLCFGCWLWRRNYLDELHAVRA
jgi:hypothetical protein